MLSVWPFGSNDFDVRGKVVVITGAGQGIGLAAAKILYGRGARIAIMDVDASSAAQTAESLGRNALAIPVDVRDRPAMAAAIEKVTGHFGRLDVVVANAGVVPAPATLRTIDPADFDRVLGINLTGVFNTIHPALDQVIENHGHVVVVGSCAAFSPPVGGSPYMISKAAVEQLGRALHLELAAVGASAGVVYFGIVDTQMTRDAMDDDEIGHELDGLLPWPLSRRISADDAARVIADAIKSRAAQAIAPAGWDVYSLLRGVANVAVDRQLITDRKLHALIRKIEALKVG